jgi:malate dehydrogenase
MSVMSDGSYGVETGIFFSYPVRCNYGQYQIINGLTLNDLAKRYFKITEEELLEEREAIKHLIPADYLQKIQSPSKTQGKKSKNTAPENYLGPQKINDLI